MVSDYRVKEARFSSFTVNGSVLSAIYLDQPEAINGEILKIRFAGVTSPGSIWIASSGANTEIFRKNDFTSGTANVEVYPFVFAIGPNGVTGSPYTYVTQVVNEPIYLAASGLTSGAAKSFGPITVFYRG